MTLGLDMRLPFRLGAVRHSLRASFRDRARGLPWSDARVCAPPPEAPIVCERPVWVTREFPGRDALPEEHRVLQHCVNHWRSKGHASFQDPFQARQERRTDGHGLGSAVREAIGATVVASAASFSVLRVRRALTLLGPVAVALTAAALAGCGGGGGSSSQAQSGAPTTTISVGTKGVGDVLMDSHTNHTLYLFTKDTGPVSTCSGACAHSWPPVRATGTPAVGSGAKASLIGTVKRSDGSAQVTYNGHPLYLFVGDNAPSSTNGQAVTAFGAPWFAVSPAGNAVTKRCAATGCSSGY